MTSFFIKKIFSYVKVTQKRLELAASFAQQIDIHNLSTGVYTPLKGFCRKNDFISIMERMQLTDWALWPIPIIFAIDDNEIWQTLKDSWIVTLIDNKGYHMADITNVEVYPFDKSSYCLSVFWTLDDAHPGVQRIQEMWNVLIGGDVQAQEGWKIKFDDVDWEKILTPEQTKKLFAERWFKEIVAFQTRNVPHRGHEYIQKCALENVDALLVHPVIGEKKSWDFQNHVILGSYEILANKYYNPERVIISCLPWVMQYAWPREAVMHAIIRQNFWCTHFIVGRDHAGVGSYYGTYDAQKIFDTLPEWALKIKILRYENAAYCPQVQWVVTDKTSPSPNAERIFISGTKFRNMLMEWIRPPIEFIREEITDYLLSEKNIFIE